MEYFKEVRLSSVTPDGTTVGYTRRRADSILAGVYELIPEEKRGWSRNNHKSFGSDVNEMFALVLMVITRISSSELELDPEMVEETLGSFYIIDAYSKTIMSKAVFDFVHTKAESSDLTDSIERLIFVCRAFGNQLEQGVYDRDNLATNTRDIVAREAARVTAREAASITLLGTY